MSIDLYQYMKETTTMTYNILIILCLNRIFPFNDGFLSKQVKLVLGSVLATGNLCPLELVTRSHLWSLLVSLAGET